MSREAAFAETASLDQWVGREPEWRDLAARAAEPNVFAESPFLIPAARFVGERRLTLLGVWGDAGRQRLIGVLGLRAPPLGWGLARIWRSEQAGLAAMLFDKACVVEALAAVLAWLKRARPGVAGLILPGVEFSGPLGAALRALAGQGGLRLEAMNPRRRAALVLAGAESFESALDKKRRKEWARQGRRLAERGRLETRLASNAEAIERFLALEAKGWKGAEGTALGADSARLAFARAMLGGFAALGRLQIDELVIEGASVAMGVTLRAGERAFYWKTAYDEAFAEYSPGVQLTLAMSRRLAREPGLALVDSCALQDHPMIDRLWPGRVELVDFAIAAQAGGARRFAAWLATERARAALRESAKRVVNELRGRKPS